MRKVYDYTIIIEDGHVTLLILQRKRLTVITNIEFSHLKTLSLRDNEIKTVPAKLQQCSKLVRVALSNNSIEDIHVDLSQVTQLSRLYLENNSLTSIDNLILPANLRELRLQLDKITSIHPCNGRVLRSQVLPVFR